VCSNGTNRHPDFLTLILPPGFLSPFYPLATHFPKWHQPISNSFTVVRRTPQVVMWWDIPCWRQVEAWTIAHLKAPVKDGDDEGHYRHCGISGRPFRFLGLVLQTSLAVIALGEISAYASSRPTSQQFHQAPCISTLDGALRLLRLGHISRLEELFCSAQAPQKLFFHCRLQGARVLSLDFSWVSSCEVFMPSFVVDRFFYFVL
jgi:hypothetical protein